jgi:hypothetical protein
MWFAHGLVCLGALLGCCVMCELWFVCEAATSRSCRFEVFLDLLVELKKFT